MLDAIDNLLLHLRSNAVVLLHTSCLLAAAKYTRLVYEIWGRARWDRHLAGLVRQGPPLLTDPKTSLRSPAIPLLPWPLKKWGKSSESSDVDKRLLSTL